MARGYGKLAIILAAGIVLLAAPLLQARDFADISGRISAEPNLYNPQLGQWRYTVDVTWNTGSRHAMSHVNLLLGLGGCTCEDLRDVFYWVDGRGDLREISDCPRIDSKFECRGDPSLDIQEPVYKFEFTTDRGCDPSSHGRMQVMFLADQPPAAITTPNAFLVGKYATRMITGQITGVFPALACNPVADQAMTWSRVKAGYLP